MEARLKTIYDNGKVPGNLSITYDDMHGLWGGMTITLSGDGTGENRERAPGDATPHVAEVKISEDQLPSLIKLLIEVRAWEQQTPERPPVPDESRATLTIRLDSETSTVWEWFNDMTKNNRLIRIKEKMSEMMKKH